MPEERAVLEARCRAPTISQRDARRARIILMAAAGNSTRAIAREIELPARTISTWRQRFADHGLAGLRDRRRPGRAPIYTEATDGRIMALLNQPPPRGYARWTGRLLSVALGDVNAQYVWRFLRAHKMELIRRKFGRESTDLEFVAKAADVLGLYLAPPENAVVLCVDEARSIRPLQRVQRHPKLPDGRAVAGLNHDFKRNGLVAALEAAAAEVLAARKKRRRRIEFFDFLNSILAVHPGKDIHVVLENLDGRKTTNERWLAAHRNVHLHFTPTRAAWVSQVEVWLSILQNRLFSGPSPAPATKLREHIY